MPITTERLRFGGLGVEDADQVGHDGDELTVPPGDEVLVLEPEFELGPVGPLHGGAPAGEPVDRAALDVDDLAVEQLAQVRVDRRAEGLGERVDGVAVGFAGDPDGSTDGECSRTWRPDIAYSAM
jgi:hypothetical protein